jgi:hypothetical protein
MYVDSPEEACGVLQETLARLNFERFPMRIDIRLFNKDSFDAGWVPRVVITLSIRDRETKEPRQIGVYVPITVRWEFKLRTELAMQYANALYQSVRQAVLHEIAECCEYEGRLLDDPHEKAPYSLRPEHDPRFPEFRNGY